MVNRFQDGLVPCHSPLPRKSLLLSFPRLSDMLKFSRYSLWIQVRTLIILSVKRRERSVHQDSKLVTVNHLRSVRQTDVHLTLGQRVRSQIEQRFNVWKNTESIVPSIIHSDNSRSRYQWLPRTRQVACVSQLTALFIDCKPKTSTVNSYKTERRDQWRSLAPFSALTTLLTIADSFKEDRNWSCCRFTYSNLVTTFAFSSSVLSNDFDSQNDQTEIWTSKTISRRSLARSRSIATTGGVYKRQGRIQVNLLSWPYEAFLVQGR